MLGLVSCSSTMTERHYKRLTCYFLSGTGNSFRAARWLAEVAAERDVATEVVPIDDARPQEDLELGPQQLVGIYHPAHGLMPPWSMIKFLLKMPRGRGAHAMVVSTRGAIPIRPVLIPGACGLALFFPLLVLLIKGYSVRGGMGIDMPINLNNLHWGMSDRNMGFVEAWGGRRHARLANAILWGKRYLHPLNVLWELLWCFPFVLWPVFPFAYLLVGRVFMGTLQFADTRCVGCGKCAKNCPAEAIVMQGEKKKQTPRWTHRCEVCMRCVGYCKFRAVETSHLWIIVVSYATSFLTASFVQRSFAAAFGKQPGFVGWVDEPIAIILTFPALILISYVFYSLQRLRPIRLFLEFTTLTRLYTRRHKAPKTTSRQLTKRSSF